MHQSASSPRGAVPLPPLRFPVALPPDAPPAPSAKLPQSTAATSTALVASPSTARASVVPTSSSLCHSARTPSKDAIAVPSPPHHAKNASTPGSASGRWFDSAAAAALAESIAGVDSRIRRAHAQAGVLDSVAAWPVRKSDPTDAAMARSRALAVSGPSSAHFLAAAKSPLAVEIDGFIRKEMRLLHREEQSPSKLQELIIFREAFGCIISRFPEYADVLARIKQQYEGVIDDLQHSYHEMIRLQVINKSLVETNKISFEETALRHRSDVDRLKSDLDRAKKDLDAANHHRLAADRTAFLANETITVKDRETEELMERIRTLSGTLREQASKTGKYVIRCNKMKSDNDRLLDLCSSLERALNVDRRKSRMPANSRRGTAVSSRKSVVVDSESDAGGALDARPEPLQSSDGEIDVDDVKRQLHEMRSPLSPHLNGPSTGWTEAHEAETFMSDEDELRERCLVLDGELRRVTKLWEGSQIEVRGLLTRLEAVQRSQEDDTMTPRPEWLKVQKRLPDFTLNAMTTSNDILDDVLSYVTDKLRLELLENERKAMGKTVVQWLGEENMCESDLVHVSNFFIARGSGPHVPVYLRGRGRVRDRKMTKGEVETLLKRFWLSRQARLKHVPAGQQAPDIDTFFLSWLEEETGGRSGAVELAYNIVHVCERYQSDPDCGLLLRVLKGEVSEMTLFDQVSSVEQLFEAIQKLDTQRHGFVSRIGIHRTMTRLFPAKSREDMHRLRFMLITFCKGADVVDYRALFREDHDGNQSRFVELLRAQHLQEITTHVVDVEESLRDVMDVDTHRLGVAACREVLQDLDNKLPAEAVERILCCGCQLTPNELMTKGDVLTVDAEDFLRRIRTGVLQKRFSPKEDATDDDDEDAGPESAEKAAEHHAGASPDAETVPDATAAADHPEGSRSLSRVNSMRSATGATSPTGRRRRKKGRRGSTAESDLLAALKSEESAKAQFELAHMLSCPVPPESPLSNEGRPGGIPPRPQPQPPAPEQEKKPRRKVKAKSSAKKA